MFAPPKGLAQLVSQRLAIVMKLGQIDASRQRLLRGGSPTDAALTELSRQVRELKRLPGAAKVESAKKRIERKLAEAAEGGQADAALSPDLDAALRLGLRQGELLLERDALTDELLRTAAACLVDQPLHAVLTAADSEATALPGWTVYGAALETFAANTTQRLDALAPADRAAETGQRLEQLLTAIRRERAALEPVMVAAFWRAYEQTALALIGGTLDDAARPHARAFLRVGMVAPLPWLVDRDAAGQVLAQCADAVTQRDPRPQATHVLHADEYLHLLAQGEVTPSFDQSLELNEKGSDRWKLDKRWRQIVWGRTIEPLLQHTAADLRARIEAANADIADLEKRIAALDRAESGYREKREALLQQAQECRIAIARMEQAVELLTQKHLKQQQALAQEAAEKMAKMPLSADPADLVRREVQAIRHVCKLSARLKETFLPLQLRDRLRFDGRRVNDRDTLLRAVADAEQRDPDVFRHVQVFAKKRENRTFVRMSPYLVIVPALGQMGYAWNPRGGTEVGRLGLPLLNARPGDLPRVLCQLLADFRFDTSKQEAGVDLLTSDTLVAAYATVRWNWRKKPRDQREKGTIYNEENDRANWRRHYELLVGSALDGGKKLFFKNPEVYAAVLRYMGLPDGVEPLS